jgi:hypothetical protein
MSSESRMGLETQEREEPPYEMRKALIISVNDYGNDLQTLHSDSLAEVSITVK